MTKFVRAWSASHEFSEDGEQSRFHFSLDDLSRRERGTGLDVAQYYWTALQFDSSTGAPRIADFDETIIPSDQDIGNTSVIDVEAEEPLNFNILRHDNQEFWRRNDVSGEGPLGCISIPMVRDACAQEYAFCKSIREPIYTEIIQVLWGFSRHYVRLLLPLVDEAGKVARLVCCTRQLEPLTLFAGSVRSRATR